MFEINVVISKSMKVSDQKYVGSKPLNVAAVRAGGILGHPQQTLISITTQRGMEDDRTVS